MGQPKEVEPLSQAAMFFAGLILLIPHRIGMSRVNFVIKRYNLPISRAGLLLYKYHNNIELSLLCGTLPGNIIVWVITSDTDGTRFIDTLWNSVIEEPFWDNIIKGYWNNVIKKLPGNTTLTLPDDPSEANKKMKVIIRLFMIVFLFLMLLSSIYMFIIYILGGDFGHLNAFYFSLIFLTLFDGFANAFAFAINAKYSSMLSAGIPLSGLLVTLLHYIYKFFSDIFLWDDFDYYVLRLQLLWNIIFIFAALILWTLDFLVNFYQGPLPKEPDITPLFDVKKHIQDFSPICMLAISLGTVYAFYPSIAPYSIIDFQYASIIELWILVISSLLPLLFAYLDYMNYGPSGNFFTPATATTGVKYTDQTIPGDKFQITHDEPQNPSTIHGSCDGDGSKNSTTFHDYGSSTDTYTITQDDKYWNPYKSGTNKEEEIPRTTSFAGKSVKFKAYQTWIRRTASINASNGEVTITHKYDRCWWCIWFCAIFYILCIQIFMSMLHYPHCLLSCFFDKPLRIGFISVLFNTLRELMQATAFSGAGKQISSSSDTVFEDYTITSILTSAPTATGHVKLTTTSGAYSSWNGVPKKNSGNVAILNIQLKSGLTTKPTIKVWKKLVGSANDEVTETGHINGTIAATNKLITLFVMMFCVFTGDGYLQHYRRCCRDCWPTTGYNKYQSFFYWLRFGFKGGIKSITSFSTKVKTQNIITNNVINLFVAAI